MEKEYIDFEILSPPFRMSTIGCDTALSWRGPHSHDAEELVYVEKGELICTAGNEKNVLKEGEMILIGGGCVHRLEGTNGVNITYIQVKAANDREESSLSEFISLRNAKPYIIERSSGELADIFFSLRNEAEKKLDFYEEYIRAYIYRLAAFMLRSGMLHKTDVNVSEIKAAAEFVEKNYMYELTLDDVAEACGYGRYHMCRIFKAVTGGTVFDYINFVRLREAEKMFLSSDKNISETAFECGFSSVQYFNKIFKKYRGCSPGRYKKQAYFGISKP